MISKRYFYRAKHTLCNIKTRALLKSARHPQQMRMNQNGSILAILLIIISIISITSMAAFSRVNKEIIKVNRDYFEMVARFTAESGIELTKRDILTNKAIIDSTNSMTKKLDFQYGSRFFPENFGRIVNCNVTAYIRADRVFLEANARVLSKRVDNTSSRVIAERTFKQLIQIKGHPPKLTTIWQVCN